MPVSARSARVSVFLFTLMVLSAPNGCSVPARPTSLVANTTAAPWLQYSSRGDAGFAEEGLQKARRYADSVRSGAVMIVRNGTVVEAWGDVGRKLELHSVRKSIVSALYGIARGRHEIDIDRTLGALGVTDLVPLTEAERGARVRDLLAARSGVYLPAAYADAGQDSARPPRGSHAPNTFFWYNNWDFNTLGVIYERFVDSSLYRSVEERLARPVGMEDYSRDDGFLVYEPSNSIHPAHTMRMSARDLARFGQLYLRGGMWNGRQVVPRNWIAESTRPHSDFADGQGYGYLWWTAQPGFFGTRYPELNRRALFYGVGTGGQLVAVIPSDSLVIVHRGDTDHGRNVPGRDAWRIVELVLEAEQGAPLSAGPRVPVSPIAFASQLPPVPRPVYVVIDSALTADIVGRYEVTPNVIVRVFAFAGRVFANFPGQGEAELFALSRSEFTIRVQSGVRILFERDERGVVKAFNSQIGPQHFRGTKL